MAPIQAAQKNSSLAQPYVELVQKHREEIVAHVAQKILIDLKLMGKPPLAARFYTWLDVGAVEQMMLRVYQEVFSPEEAALALKHGDLLDKLNPLPDAMIAQIAFQVRKAQSNEEDLEEIFGRFAAPEELEKATNAHEKKEVELAAQYAQALKTAYLKRVQREENLLIRLLDRVCVPVWTVYALKQLTHSEIQAALKLIPSPTAQSYIQKVKREFSHRFMAELSQLIEGMEQKVQDQLAT